MSQENVEIVRRGFDYVQTTGQLDPETMHPDFVWDTTTFRGGMRRRACVGVDEANAWISRVG